MKLSTRARYGTRFMFDLARHYGEGPIYLGDIARRQEISEKYLGNIVRPLKNAGLIRAQRGAHGGYMLSRHPGHINLFEVVRAVEGPLSLVECITDPEVCSHSNACIHRDVWNEVHQSIVRTLTSITLYDLVEKYRKGQKTGILYHI